MTLHVVPISFRELNTFVAQHHRHHKPVRGHKFSIGCADDAGNLVGACAVGRPVARKVDFRTTAEVTRLVTDGTKNACSILYAAAARTAKAMGYKKIQTYILDSEPGISLKASGWIYETTSRGGQWVRTDGAERRTDQPTCPKQRWAKALA